MRTIFRKLLEDSVNGDRIVEHELDNLITADPRINENSIDYSIDLNFEGIFKEESPNQTRVVNDLLDLRAEHREHWESLTRLVRHPVIAAFVIEKWRHVRWYYYWSSVLFVLFLLSFSGFTYYLFVRPEVHCSSLEKQLYSSRKPHRLSQVVFPDSNRTCRQMGGEKDKEAEMFLSEWDNGFSVLEAAFLSLALFLTVTEFYQVMILRLQYVKELENYVEWIVLVSAYVTMAFKHTVRHEDSSSAAVRGVAAIGICAAWLELIFIIGRYPRQGGATSASCFTTSSRRRSATWWPWASCSSALPSPSWWCTLATARTASRTPSRAS